MSLAHTPGPWEVGENEHGDQTRRFIWSADETVPRDEHHRDTHFCVATVNPRGSVETLDANARLIAAAPDLVEAMRKARDELEAMLVQRRCPSGERAADILNDALVAAGVKQ